MPLPKAELLFEGSYLYYQNGINYSQENFKVQKVAETNFIQINAEILSRIETGKFLKVLVRFEMNQHQLPVFVEIEKSIGNKHALESFKIDTITQELRYSFQGSEGQHNSSKPINARHYLNSPALSTAGVFTLTKKFDAAGRTPVFLINSNNDWTFEAPPSEKVIYVEYSARDMEDFKLNNN